MRCEDLDDAVARGSTGDHESSRRLSDWTWPSARPT